MFLVLWPLLVQLSVLSGKISVLNNHLIISLNFGIRTEIKVYFYSKPRHVLKCTRTQHCQKYFILGIIPDHILESIRCFLCRMVLLGVIGLIKGAFNRVS